MASSPPPGPSSPAAGGAILALTIMAGSIIGLVTHQPTIGFLIGLAIGVAAASALWLRDRRR